VFPMDICPLLQIFHRISDHGFSKNGLGESWKFHGILCEFCYYIHKLVVLYVFIVNSLIFSR
jgi:hypothetical protein